MVRVIFCLLLFTFLDLQSQEIKNRYTVKYVCKWGDKKLMELSSNGRVYKFKSGIRDGLYIATFDRKINSSSIKDTAMVATIINGELNGLVRRWDEDDKTLAEECEYKNGLMDGRRRLYFFDPEGNMYTNIEVFKEGLPIKTLQVEW